MRDADLFKDKVRRDARSELGNAGSQIEGVNYQRSNVPRPADAGLWEVAVGNETGRKIMRDIVLAFTRVHVLHHAAEDRIFGLEREVEKKSAFKLRPTGKFF
jgi:hypothetical protein